MCPDRPNRSITTHDPLPSTFDPTTARIRCALCDDPNAEWPNTDEGKERMKEHGAAKHSGRVEYTVLS